MAKDDEIAKKKKKSKLRKKNINIFMRWCLQRKGYSHAKGKVPSKSDVEGYEKYYYTPYMREQIGGFISIAESVFSEINDKLTELNEKINNLSSKREARFQQAKTDINDILREILKNKNEPPTANTKAKGILLEDNLHDTEKSAIIDIQNINSEGTKAEHDAKRLIENYNISFNEGLTNCEERLDIYWGSLYLKHIKVNSELEINARLPNKEDLLVMCSKVNPSASHKIIPYVVLNLDLIEKLKNSNN